MNVNIQLEGLAKLQGSMTLEGSPFVYNIDLLNWINRLTSYNLPLPSDLVIFALNSFLNNLEKYGLRQKIKRLNLFCAGNWLGSFFPIIIDVGNAWDYNGKYGVNPASLASGSIQASDWSLTTGYNFISNADYWPDTNPGVNGNLSSNILKVIDTTYPENNISLSNNSIHVSCFISDINNTSPITTYCTDVGGDSTYFNFQCAYNGNAADNNIVRFNCYTQSLTDTAGGVLATNTFSPQGFYIGSRVSTTLNTMYKAGYYQNLAIASNGYNPNYNQMVSTPSSSSSTLILGGKTNGVNIPSGSNRVVNNVTDRTYSMYSIGTALTDTEALIFNNIVVNFNTTIGRANY
jgi:hypothetical protein